MKVINIDSKREDVEGINYDALHLIKSVISEINSGEIVSLGVSWVTKNGSIGGDVSSGDDKVALWASLEHSAKSFYNDVIMD